MLLINFGNSIATNVPMIAPAIDEFLHFETCPHGWPPGTENSNVCQSQSNFTRVDSGEQHDIARVVRRYTPIAAGVHLAKNL